ncbi:MAG: TRAP transporter large permease [Betaproteobacteria bacterium]
MSATAVGVVGLAAFFALLALRMPVALALLTVGLLGTAALNGWSAALSTLSGQAFAIATFAELAVIPLFVLMGNLAGASRMSRDLYDAAYAWVGHWRGGLASSTVVGCAGFAALSGSSIASAVTMGRVALPEMKRYRYDDRLATGCVAAGGTLGILIPPSTGFVFYAVLTEQSIGKLFMAGILPGILLTALFVAAIGLLTAWRPDFGPAGPRSSMPERRRALGRAVPIIAVATITIGGLYVGLFTTVEAAGAGAFLVFLVAWWRRSLDLARMKEVLLHTMQATATSFLILIGAYVFSPFISLSRIPAELAALLGGLDLGAYGTLAIVLTAYVLLGMFMEGLAMLVITLPIVFPLLTGLGFDPIWFGVLVVIVLEMGLISPPVGVNVYVIKGIAAEVPMGRIFQGILPFWAAMGVCLLLLVAFPQIATLLPGTMTR